MRPAGATRLVGIDGFAGSGKSTLAADLAASVADAAVVAIDDFLSYDDDSWWNWPEPARVLAEVVGPLAAGDPARYRPYDWEARLPGPFREVAPGGTVIVEGVTALHPLLAARYDLRVWVDCPEAVRLARGIERDGEGHRAHWERWMAREDAYRREERPRERADVIVDGTAPREGTWT